MCDFATNQRVSHLACAVADAVGGGDGVLGLYQPQRELTWSRPYTLLEAGVDCIHFRHDAEIALAVAFGAHDADRGFMDQRGVGAEDLSQSDRLGRTARVTVNEHGLQICHGVSL